MSPDAPVWIRSDCKGASIPVLLLSIPLLIMSAAVIRTPRLPIGMPLLCCSALPLLFVSWLLAFEIELGPDAIGYRSLGTLLRRRRIPYEAIGALRIDAGPGETAHLLAGMVRLVFSGHEGEELLVLDMKPFSVAGLAHLVRTVQARRPDVQIDEGVAGLVNRDLGPAIEAAIPGLLIAVLAFGAAVVSAAVLRSLLR